jgi:hypothetical protein
VWSWRDIPRVDGNERTDLLHPVLAARVAALCAAIPGLKVDSAARTHAEQLHLFQGWVNGLPGFNLAADPDRPLTPAYGLPSARGSWHMQQPDGHAYAVDLNHSTLTHTAQAALQPTARDLLLIPTVPSEPWHFQMAWGDWWTVPNDPRQPAKEWDEMATKAEIEAAVRGVVSEIVVSELGGVNARLNDIRSDQLAMSTEVDRVSTRVDAIADEVQGRNTNHVALRNMVRRIAKKVGLTDAEIDRT